jgi:acyl phosphate:glycerol-3-phosphate acyltransferase
MMMNFSIVFCLVVSSFFCGAIPTGYLIVRALKRQDIRGIGSGNIGSTNVWRAAGGGASLITLIVDIAKGAIPVAIALIVSRSFDFDSANKIIVLAAIALVSILGHDFSPFLKFHGGKGVNTTVGAFLLLAPIPVIMGIGVFYLLRPITSIVSVRSLALGFVIAAMTGILKYPPAIILASWLAAILIVVRHVDNIQRLFRHNELQ